MNLLLFEITNYIQGNKVIENSNLSEIEILISAFFLLIAAFAYGWIGLNFFVDDRKLNKIISPLMIINSLFYLACIFYSFDFQALKIIIFLIFSKAFWGVAIIPFANVYFKERASYVKVSKYDLIFIIQVAITKEKITISDITNIGLNEESVKSIINHIEFSRKDRIDKSELKRMDE